MLKTYGGRIQMHEEFLGNVVLDTEEKGRTPQSSGSVNLDYSKDLLSRSFKLQLESIIKATSLLQIAYSSWKPELGVEGLIQTLKEEGPLGINGLFGRVSYIDAPFETTQKVQGRAIFAWRPQASRNPVTFKANSVLLVGAKQEASKAYVYFIDPEDPSDPQAQTPTQRIYMISYQNFQNSLCNIRGELEAGSSHPFAYRGNFIKGA